MSNTLISIKSGAHPRLHCPIHFATHASENLQAVRIGETTVPVQRGEGGYVLILPSSDSDREFHLEPVQVDFDNAVTLKDTGKEVEVDLDGERFVAYRYADTPARPWIYPVLAPGGIPVTRAWPIEKDIPGEVTDHPHHRSLYFAHGDVNGEDNWSEEKGHASTIHSEITELTSGAVYGRLATLSQWVGRNGDYLLTQRLKLTFWRACPQFRLMDVDLELCAEEKDVIFGDTKEGGVIAVRVATSMDAAHGGHFENSYGGKDEAEIWGRPAHWCDYYGEVQGRTVGIAVMDHQDSFRHPAWWHARNYGLMTVNPFALSDFTHRRLNGAYLLEKGQTMRFLFRVMVHKGDAIAADVRGRYLDFVSPPCIEWS
jgi:hypothetical protein